jgi:hypothetical protein
MASVNSEHIGEESLEGYVLAHVAAQTAPDVIGIAALEEHMLVCEYCRTRVERFEEDVAALRTALTASVK